MSCPRFRVVPAALAAALLTPPLLAPSRAAAQLPLEELALRLDLGDRVRVTDSAGRRVTGQLTALTADALALRTDGGITRVAGGAVRDVAVARPAFRRGAMIGAGAMAVLGAVTMCSNGEDNCLVIGTLGAAPLGAGIGLAAAALVPRLTTVLRRAPGDAPAPGQPLRGFRADLALHANLNDRVVVEEASGARTDGRLAALTADGITLRTATGERAFARDAVRAVSVRRPRHRTGVLAGAGVGAAGAAVAACTGDEREECPFATLLGGAAGAVVGLGLGTLLPKTVPAYPVAARDQPAAGLVEVTPLVGRQAMGLQVHVTW
jgi:hypothetical protein